ncbi:MAG TPA: tRNA epoxyqueuosine(34) reductase QueG [Anaeromyxobacteraceae bacterium]|nr:tRNA epoxyqueuosine(34) reductase QueG [Anaeromyxobacteraceae bacterium]
MESAFVKEAALAVGFHKVGIARAVPLDAGPLDRVLAHGWEADMVWLGSRREQRLDPERLLPGARSVVALALSYLEESEVAQAEPASGRVARYARGRDYHAVMRRKLKQFLSRLREQDPGLRAFASADVAPVMEKAWAQRAGLGWVGKNGCLITTDLGSYVLLATAIVDRDLAPDPPHPARCGSCAACLESCPTAAIVSPGFIDARRCISFQTIERRGPVPEEVAARLGPWVFGCDDCQTVCPWNRAPAARCDPELRARSGQVGLDLDALLRLSLEEYQRRFHGTALARARYEGLLRNAILSAGHAGDPRRLEGVRAHLASPFPGVREAAKWAEAHLCEESNSPTRPPQG